MDNVNVNDNGSEPNVHGWDKYNRPVCKKAKDILAAGGRLCRKYNFEETPEVISVSLEEKKPKDFLNLK
jgi:hypothetical protein